MYRIRAATSIVTFSNSGPNSIDGFIGLSLAAFQTKVPSEDEYRSDCKGTEMQH